MRSYLPTNITSTSTSMSTVHWDILKPTTTEDAESNDTGLRSDALHHLEEGQSPGLFYAILSAIFVLGIISNSLLILIFLLQKSMRTAPNTYIFNLALADLFTVVSCSVAPLLQGGRGTLSVLCRGVHVLLGTCMGVISFTLVALSAERYYAIAKPLHRRISSKKFTISVAALTWAVSATYNVEKMIMLGREHQGNVCGLMFDPSSYAHVYSLVDFFALYVIPLVAITIFYTLLAKELYFSDRFVSKDPNANSTIPKHMKVRKRIALTVLVLVLTFAVFYFPFNYLSLRLYLNSEYMKGWSRSTNVLFCVGCLHGCINPLVLYSLSESFRGHFNNYFRSPDAVRNEHTSCHCPECSQRLSSSGKLGNTAAQQG